MKDRVKQIMYKLFVDGVTKTEFSKTIGYTSTRQLNNVIDGNSTLSGNAIIKMIEIYKVNPNYLFLGQEPIFTDNREFKQNVVKFVNNRLGLNKSEYKIVTSHSAQGLNNSVNALIKEGWKPVGSHTVVTTLMEVLYAGTRHKYEVEYSQTMIKE